jgi:hypothetical protein
MARRKEASMASPSESGSLGVDQLLEAVAHLSPAEQREFRRRLTAGKAGKNGGAKSGEAALVRAARARLPAEAERRLRKLIARAEAGRLTAKERSEYQSLAEEVQRIDAARAEALAELARRRGQPVRAMKALIEREGRTDGA